MDRFLKDKALIMMKALDKNILNDIFGQYDVNWDFDDEDDIKGHNGLECTLVHKLRTDYDFVEANKATKKLDEGEKSE